tara:strand:- start:783 stop:1010 length:228 start_codon:yes stop_codon:yes gene_type:complete
MGMLSGDDCERIELQDSIARKERRLWHLQTHQIPMLRQRVVELRIELGLLEDKIKQKNQVTRILKLIKKAGNGNE